VAEAIAEGIRTADPGADVRCDRIAESDLDFARTADLLVVGGPTHMHGVTTGLSRKMGLESEQKNAADYHPDPDAAGPGVRDWFHTLPKATKGSRAAAFDTRIDNRFAGGAANGIARRLRHHRYDLVAEPEGFIVEDTEGPLRSGERERAVAWASALVH
jgi:hypothetical protein